MNLLDFIFPKKCVGCGKFGNFICDSCFSKIKFNDYFVCPVCLRMAVDGMVHPHCATKYSLDGALSAVVYGGIVKKLIYQFKYEPNLSELNQIMGQIMTEGLLQNESFYSFCRKYNPVIVPIPLSPKRLRKRGYNHAELLAKYVSKYFNLKINSKVLVRIKETKPQFRLNREERKINIEGAFAVNSNIKAPESVILFDDIATSFITLKEAAKVLKHAGAKKVLGVTFAREL